MKLYLVRHGASTGNTPGNLIGHSDHSLTAAGEAQAHCVAARLAPLGPMPIFCSDLPRARETAECIAEVWRGDGRLHGVTPDARLREIDLGEFEGRSWDDFLADTALGARLEADPFHAALPGGESLAQLQERVLAAVRGIVDGAPQAPPAVCLVSHDGPIRCVINHCLGVPPQKWWVLSTTHGGLSLLEFSDDWVNVRFANDTGHLADAPGTGT
jgi:broad specificity phosphatase PhoE